MAHNDIDYENEWETRHKVKEMLENLGVDYAGRTKQVKKGRRKDPIWYNKTKSIAKSYRAMLRKDEHTEREKQEMEAIAGALQWIGEQPDGVSKAAAMRGTYIDGKPLYLAAEAAGYTLSGIKRTHRRFLTKIAENLGYL